MMEGYYSEKELSELGLKAVGRNVLISKKTSIYMPGHISIGHDVRIDDYCFLVGDITIENYIHLAPYVSIHGTGGGTVLMRDFSALSSYSTVYAGSDDYGGEFMTNPMVDEEYRSDIYSDIVLEKHVIVGLHSTLLPGAFLAEGCALGAMTLINKPTEPWSIYVGIPGKKIKERKKELLHKEEMFLQKHSYEY